MESNHVSRLRQLHSPNWIDRLYLSLPADERTFDMRRIAELAASGAAKPRPVFISCFF